MCLYTLVRLCLQLVAIFLVSLVLLFALWEEGTVEAAVFDAEPDFFRCTKLHAQEY